MYYSIIFPYYSISQFDFVLNLTRITFIATMNVLLLLLLLVVCIADLSHDIRRADNLLAQDGPTLSVLSEFSAVIKQAETTADSSALSQLYFKKSLIEINIGREKRCHTRLT